MKGLVVDIEAGRPPGRLQFKWDLNSGGAAIKRVGTRLIS